MHLARLCLRRVHLTATHSRACTRRCLSATSNKTLDLDDLVPASTPTTSTLAAPTGTSYAQRGAAFERDSLRVLEEQLGVQASVVGGAYDRGVDFRGEWAALGVRVVGQCKLQTAPVGSGFLRELGGVLQAEEQGDEVVGLFASATGYSPEAQRVFKTSTWPMILATLPVPVTRVTHLQLNRAARRRLPDLVVGTTRTPDGTKNISMMRKREDGSGFDALGNSKG